jgi:CRP-like cAMP-binding protein
VKGATGLQDVNKANLLEESAIFKPLSADEIAELFALSVYYSLAAGEFVYQEGDSADRLYIIARGRIKLMKYSSEGNEFIIGFMEPGEMFGIAAALADKIYSCSTIAVEESDVLEIRKEDFLHLIESHPKIGLDVIKILGGRIIKAQERLRELAGEKVEQRLLKTLLRLFLAHGAELHFTRHELADMTGTTTETIIRICGQLREKGIIESARGKIIIADPVQLRQLGEKLPKI